MPGDAGEGRVYGQRVELGLRRCVMGDGRCELGLWCLSLCGWSAAGHAMGACPKHGFCLLIRVDGEWWQVGCLGGIVMQGDGVCGAACTVDDVASDRRALARCLGLVAEGGEVAVRMAQLLDRRWGG